ncbi:MAG: succinate dehydrogenase assembly factor 2 [Mesorhizobium sp.]|jgi:antitoxin CptB|nr:succinate dehydrogenase assembly factor 2 [Mesorhizobium sp.]MBN9244064.1 succinate dehydrogenase assembly factor 2 [Mesorhizobium sp.]MBN9272242.1 succinate dehydrogenase assembly factor 2 [Mesorhizobium sp.]
MTGTAEAANPVTGDLHPRRKKLLFRSWHRGMREMDFILGRFADAEIAGLTGDELDQYERLLDFPDDQFFLLVTGDLPVPAHLDCPLLDRILAFGRTSQI